MAGRYDRSVSLTDQSGDFINLGNPLPTSGSGGGGGGTAQADKSTFTEGTTNFTPAGGVRLDTPASDVADGKAAAFRITPKRGLWVTVHNTAGTEIGTASAPFRIDPTGTTAQPITDNGGSITIDDGGGSLTVDGTVAATQSGTWAVQLTDGLLTASIRNTGLNDSLNVAIVDASGNQITAFGGGVQYTEGDIDTTPTGTAAMWWDRDDNSLRVASQQRPFPVVIPNPTQVTDTISALNDTVTIGTDGMGVVRGSIGNGIVGDVEFQGSHNGSTWESIFGYLQSTGIPGAVFWDYTTTGIFGAANSSFTCPVAGYSQFRIVVISYNSGSSSVTLETAAGSLHLDLAVPVSTTASVLSVVPGTATSHLGKAEDNPHSSGDTGVMSLGVRTDTPVANAFVSADRDYVPFIVDNKGKLWTAGDQVDDASHTSGDRGNFALAVRRDADTSLCDADGDYTGLQVDAVGRLKAALTKELPAGTQNIGDVDVLSVIPGTGATNLGKAEGGTPSDGDTGVAVLGIRQNDPGVATANFSKYAIPYLDRLGQLRVYSRPDRLVEGRFMVVTFRTLGNAATPQNLFTIENANGSPVIIALLRLEVASTYTAVLTAVESEAVFARTTALPSGGTTLTQVCTKSGTAANSNVTCRGATASDGGAATAITATANTFINRQFIGRIHTAVGEIQSKTVANLRVGDEFRDPFMIFANEGVVVQIVAAAAGSNAATNHYVVKAEFEVFTLP